MDLTRFDFYAMRFIYSEDVMAMSAEEVGQYILLMCHAWLGGKGASLPDDPVLLATYARAEGGQVSSKVLIKFPLVETERGARRRNETLYREWEKVLLRYNEAAGRKGGLTKSTAKSEAARENGKLGGRPKNPSETQQNPSNNPSPNPNQAIPDQAVPSQSEQETNEMSMKNRINAVAGKGTVDGRNNADFEFLARRYGKETVINDFDVWYSGTNGLLQYPASAYLKVAESRLKSEAESVILLNDPRISAIVGEVYLIVQRTPRSGDVSKLLADYSDVEILEAFRAYAEPLDEYETKFAAKNFFQDGGGVGIILARRQKKSAEEKQAAVNTASVDAGIAARKAENDARAEKIRAEQELADKLGDSPF